MPTLFKTFAFLGFSLVSLTSFADILSHNSGSASSYPNTHQKKHKLQTSLIYGQSAGELRWHIGGGHPTSPNILSELTYQNLESRHWTTTLDLIKPLNEGWSFTSGLKLRWGEIISGQAIDSDFAQHNRQNEYSRSYSSLTNSSLLNLSLSGGLKKELFHFFHLSSKLGYHFREQNFHKKNGYQAIATANHTMQIGHIDGLNSQYYAQWQGIFAGLQATFLLSPKDTITLNIEQHLNKYYAEADWNLREDLAHPKSFDQMADATGQIISFTYTRIIFQDLDLTASYERTAFNAQAGIDKLYFADGTTASSRLNEAIWNNDTLALGLSYRL